MIPAQAAECSPGSSAAAPESLCPIAVRILILHRFVPPEAEAAAILFGEIADALKAHGHEVNFLGAGREPGDAIDDAPGARGGVKELWCLITRGCAAPRPDVILTGSLPRGVLVAGSWVARWHRARHLHWSLEKFPDLGAALRLPQPAWLSGMMRKVARRAFRRAALVVAVDGDMAEGFQQAGIQTVECRPWAPAAIFEHMPFPPPGPAIPWTWIYSGTLGRGHDWQTLLAAQAEIENRRVDATLVFQGGGEAWPAAKARAKELGLRQVVWRPPSPDGEFCRELLRSHCLVATQVPELRGLCWPSKLALLLGMPRPLLFVGAEEGAIASLVAHHPLGRCFSSGDFRAVADWIEALRATPVEISYGSTVDVSAHRKQALAAWVSWVEGRAK